MVSGQRSSGNSVRPLTLLWNVPYARKLRNPGMRIGLSSGLSLTFGRPIITMPAPVSLSRCPSIAASAAG
jgi:hypothetical protein